MKALKIVHMTKIDETKDIISYKLIITTDNGDETRDIEVRKRWKNCVR